MDSMKQINISAGKNLNSRPHEYVVDKKTMDFCRIYNVTVNTTIKCNITGHECIGSRNHCEAWLTSLIKYGILNANTAETWKLI